MGKKTAAPGHFLIPTAPAVGTTVAQSASANTFGTLTSMGNAPSDLFITGIYISGVPTTNIPTYVAFEIAIVSATIVDMGVVDFGPTTGVAGTAQGVYKPIFPPVPVASGVAILTATASSIASAISWKVTLECIAQANVVDDGIVETANATQFAGQTITAGAGVTMPATVASTTNITGGTITTVTNLTNAPTAGDLTSTMKASVTASLQGKTTFNE
jgi:hypothetical protein